VSGDESLPVGRFDYDLPEDLIAQEPVEPRDAARLLVVDRQADSLTDRHFRDLPDFLRRGDLLIVNDTRVLPARLLARRQTGGQVEFLLLSRRSDGSWLSMARPARRLRAGDVLRLVDHHGLETSDEVTVLGRTEDGLAIRFGDESAIEQWGRTPLPPYIKQEIDDPERYQTVYAREPGSAAAPTAGMHFTPELIERCEHAGAELAYVTLHVGLDTFQPIKTEDARDHPMHSEWYHVSPETIARIRATRAAGGRIIAVGTTSVRTLESIASPVLDSETGNELADATRLFITPGFSFRLVDVMITNFHLPRTTLLLLVAALTGEDLMRRAYAHAIEQRYRFYSFGDAMLIV
jgi:S-adenosylmethionine:tRNA ribosyltransferase-isomerase